MNPGGTRRVFSGRWLDVDVEAWDGREREVVIRPDVVAIVPIDVEGSLTLVNQFRPPARRELLELPAGRLEEGEEPLPGARRELEEETGFHGGVWSAPRSFWTTPGFCRERVYLFVATNLTPGPAAPDEDESIELVRWRPEEIQTGLALLEDAKTIVGVLLYLQGLR